MDVIEASSSDSLLCILMIEKNYIPLSCWYHIYQIAKKEANCCCVQLLSNDPQNGENWSREVEAMKVGPFKGGFVSC